MGDLSRMNVIHRREKATDFASHTGDIDIISFINEQGDFRWDIVFASNPTSANFSSLSNNSLLIDTNSPGVWKIKDATGDNFATVTVTT